MQSEIVYSAQKRDFLPGVRYANPRYFTDARADVSSVIVVGGWQNVVDAYLAANPGMPIVRVETPDALAEYLDRRMRTLVSTPGAQPLAGPGVTTYKAEGGPRFLMPVPTLPVDDPFIPDDWRDLSWQEKRDLASRFSNTPLINAAQADAAIEAEVAKRATTDDWESLPWFSLRKRVEDETGQRPKNKAEAIEMMRART